jgi:tRNA uridine 5-carboxymethylaminomethyl modification enzyme
MVQRLTELRPMTLGHASRIPGVTPAAVAVIATYLDRSSQRQSAEGDL